MLINCAWTSIRKKDSYLRTKYYLLVKRMGPKKAIAAIAHKILIACYAVLHKKEPYKELGSTFFENGSKDKLVKYYQKKLDKLGYNVTLSPAQTVA